MSVFSRSVRIEVDFPLEHQIAVEVKAKASVGPNDLKSLHALAEEGVPKRRICVSLEPRPRKVGGIVVLPFGEFLDRPWAGELT